MRVALAALVASSLNACTCAETTISLRVEGGPFAVTASSIASLSQRSCRTFAFNKTGHVGTTDTVCTSDSVDIGEAWVDDPSLFGVTADRSVVTFTALAPGVTTLHVREPSNVGGEVHEAQLEARRPRRVEVDFGCDAGSPFTIVAESKFTLGVRVFDGDVELTGAPERPLTSNLLAPVERGTMFVASATPGLGSITSDHDPALNIALRVFAVGEASLEVPPPTLDKWGSNTASFRSYLLIDGRHACIDKTAHRFEVLTPNTCNLGQDTQGQILYATERYAGDEAVAKGMKGSTCRLRLSINDHPETAVELTHAF